MNFEEVGERIRLARERNLKITREEFAEEIGISVDTAYRLESGSNKKVKNVETFIKVSEVTGLTLEELLLGKNESSIRNRNIKKINYLLNVLSDRELDYIYFNISQFIKILHEDEVNTLKDIKDKSKEDNK